MKTILSSRLAVFMLMAVAMISAANADTIDLSAGYNAGAQNSYFKIEDNTSYDLTNLVFTATGVGTAAGWNDTWSVADVTAGQFAINYFAQATEAFAANFANLYANSVTPGDIAYSLSGVLNGQAIQLPFSGRTGTAFLGLDQYGNSTNANDFGQVASASVSVVPLPGALYLFATSMIGYAVSRKRKQQI